MNYEELCGALQLFNDKTYCYYGRFDLPSFFNGRSFIWPPEIVKNNTLSYKEKKQKLLSQYGPVIKYINDIYSLPLEPLVEKHILPVKMDVKLGVNYCCEWHATALAQRGSAKAQYTIGARLLYYTTDSTFTSLQANSGAGMLGFPNRYIRSTGQINQKSLEEDILWLKLAGESGITDAYWVLGKGAFAFKAYEAAINWFKTGATVNDSKCMVALGDICSNELQNTDEALKWYLSAAELGSLEAKKACAAIYSYNTKNTKANYRLAIEYYQMVIDQEGKEKSEDFQYRVDRYKK